MTARRDWFVVQCRLIRLPKFRRLSDAAQLALVYVWALAADETPEATWESRPALAEALELHGRDPVTLDELTSRGWLDTLENGRVAVHDWDDHQYAASREIKNAWEADRLRTWRAAKSAKPPTPPDSTTQHSTGVRTSYGDVRTPGANGSEEPSDGVLPEPPGLPSKEEAGRILAEIRAGHALTALP